MKHSKYMVKAAGGRKSRARASADGFTLIELLVSITFLVILMLVVTQVMGIVQRTWVRSNSRVSQFREARKAFDLLSSNLSQATLNTYWASDLKTLNNDALGQAIQTPDGFKRQSELHFICGPTTEILTGATMAQFPGHAVFFQAPLGVVRTDASAVNAAAAGTATTVADMANLTNLICGRGYFVELDSDAYFRPSFLNSAPYSTLVPTRTRLRLMEYSPTADANRIYDSNYRSNPSNIRQWYQNTESGALANDVRSAKVNGTENDATFGRFFTRPIAENILALVISPQTENTSTTGTASSDVYQIAPDYTYDSSQLGPAVSGTAPQGTQHLLPPLLKVTMIALDERSGEYLASTTNTAQLTQLMTDVGGLFKSASRYTQDLEGTPETPGALRQMLLAAKLNYRVFTTTIALRQARWSF
ncbi:Verru_Chthon cassette protein C [Prosthecobacter vanneervenii]|uniref:Uncharacterized protein (TIGR02599 family) n=1 Tax=Prosthecobacter vanneervenii TaxID=48466 RepID=A0A7W7YBZ3_9BACT|nr:Verru_Chthon cassette protein C [Prosthecobacter vanneervenii]MBB5033324.1 uncharacterized protein (TIGR02599 family) [Prosthecobacter vanneervenii]